MDLLQRLRDRVCNEGGYKLLASESLRMVDLPDGGGEWKFVPVIVTSGAARNGINCRDASAFSE